MKAARYLLSLVALLCFVEVILPDATAQQTEELRKEFQSVKAKAEKGDAEAQYDLGLMYYEGKGVKKDYTEAKMLWRKIADQGHALARSNLMAMHEKGHGVSNKNAITGFALFGVIALLVGWVIYQITVDERRAHERREQERREQERREHERREQERREQERREQERRKQERKQQEQQRKPQTRAESKPKQKRAMPPDVRSALVAFALDEEASFEDVRRAYREHVKQYHPDKVAHLGADLRKLAETKTKEFNAAYAKLETFYASSK